MWRLLRWWWKARQIARNTRVLNRSTKLLCRTLLNFPGGKIVGQPLPAWQRTDDRYELLSKLQGVLRSLQFDGILVLVDRVDEPYLDQRRHRPDAGAGLADVGQQVPQASRPGAEAAAADRVGAAAWTARTATSISGPGWTSRT